MLLFPPLLRRGAPFGLVSSLLLAAACGGGSSGLVPLAAADDVEGSYALSLEESGNDCALDGWEEAAQGGVTLALEQEDTDASGVVSGAWLGDWLSDSLGSPELSGNVASKHVVLKQSGTSSFTRGDCAYTVDATLDALLEGDVLEGTLRFEPRTNGAADCAALDDCENVLRFSGPRAKD